MIESALNARFSPAVSWTRFIFVALFFLGNFQWLCAQVREDRYKDSGLHDRVIGYANPNLWADESWADGIAEFIFEHPVQGPDELNDIYSRILSDIAEVYGQYGLTINPESDAGRFQALQLAINERVDKVNQHGQSIVDWSIGAGLLVGGTMGAAGVFFRGLRAATRRQLVSRMMIFGTVGASCGALLAGIPALLVHKPLPPFDEANPALVANWQELDKLLTKSSTEDD